MLTLNGGSVTYYGYLTRVGTASVLLNRTLGN